MKSGFKAISRAALALASLLALAVDASAQVLYDPNAASNAGQVNPYAPQQPPGSTGLSTYSPYGQTGATTPIGQPATSAQQPTGAVGEVTPVGTYQPSTLPDYSTTDVQNGPAQPLTASPMASGANPGALYARPTGTPGQFQLLQKPAAPLSEFEQFVLDTVGRPLPRFGSQLVLQRTQGFAAPAAAAIPPDYRLQPGDELMVSVSGSVEARLRLIIDTEGKIFVPRVGAINLAGLRYGDLQDALSRRFSEQFKQARVSVVISRLHGVTVYVTGFAVSPGAYVVSSLATAADAALVGGGPNAGGSFRNITVHRSGRVVTHIDLYDLLLRGDKSKDVDLQNGDVVNIEPVGAEVAVVGSVNLPAIYEARDGETFADMVADAGGSNSLADDTRLVVRRLSDLDRGGTRQISVAEARGLPAERASIVSVLSLGRVARPLERQDVLVTIEGEVDRPGRYFLPAGTTLGTVLGRAGGLTSSAFVYGVEFDRQSVREQQKVSYDRALDDLQLAALAAPLSALNSSNPNAGQVRAQAAQAIIAQLKTKEPNGRVVLNLPITASQLPGDLTLENNDRIFVPPRPKTVGVFGAVFQTGAFLFTPGSRLRDYMRQSGGPQRVADRGEIFVVRLNGSVLSSRQNSGLFNLPAYPGDVIFVPVRTSPGLLERLRDIADVVGQFGLGAAAIAVLAGR